MPRDSKGTYLKRNPHGVWDINWTINGRSRRISTGCKDVGEAEKVFAQFLIQKNSIDVKNGDTDPLPLTISEALGDPEVKEHCEDYWHEHVVPNVIGKGTQKIAIKKLHQHFGQIAIRDLKPIDTISYISKRQKGELGLPSINSTIARELTVLSSAINHAAKHRISRLMLRQDQRVPIIDDPVTDGPRDRWLRFDEAEAILKVARSRKKRLSRVYLFMMIALHTAARSEAIRQLTWFQVDLDRRLINFNPAGRAQTNKRRATVSISDTLYAVLAQAKEERVPIKRKKEKEKRLSEYVLESPASIKRAFYDVIEDAGLAPPKPWEDEGREPKGDEWRVFWQARITPHTFRHTWATWAAQRGETMFSIAGVLGDTIKTVENNYAHHHPDHQKQTMNATPRIGAL